MSKYGKVVGLYLRRVQEGDKEQLGLLFDEVANHLRRLAATYLFDKSNCDDVIGDAFKQTLQYIDTFDESKDGYNWLCKIVENCAYAYNKQTVQANANCVPLEEAYDVADKETDAELSADISDAMQDLSEADKSIVYDYFYRGLTLEQIAEKRGTVKSAIHKRLHTAYKVMAKRLRDGYGRGTGQKKGR